MPEGPEVRVIADALNQTIRGHVLVNLSFDSSWRYNKTEGKNAKPNQAWRQQCQSFLNELPLTLHQITTRGKRLIFHFDRDIFLVSFLGMEGHWMFQPEKHSNLWLDFGRILPTTPPLRVIEHTLYFDDSRHFGILDFCFGQPALHAALKHIGPDLLQDIIPLEQWRQVLT